MKVAAQQPHFLPWPPYWHKVLEADVFLLWSGVDYSKGEYINRVRHAGSWLTLPVTAQLGQPIHDVVIAKEQRRLIKIAKTVDQVRGKYRSRLDEVVELLYHIQPGDNLAAVNSDLLRAVIKALGRSPSVFMAAPLRVTEGSKTERLRKLLDTYTPGVKVYLTGIGARNYLHARFLNCEVWWQDISRFDPEMSILQLIANEPDPVDYILTTGGWA